MKIEIEEIRSDLTVVGGGISGMCAAVAAARSGLKVALVNDRPVLGGNASSEIGVSINGAASNGGSPSVYAREGGIIEEIKLEMLRRTQDLSEPWPVIDLTVRDGVFLDIILREPNIRLFQNTLVQSVETEGAGHIKIIAAQGIQLASERRFRFSSPYFVDATGDGSLGAYAGAAYRRGREGRKEFGESQAPEVPDDYTLGSSMLLWTKNAGRPVKYIKPDFAHDIRKLPFFKNLGVPELHRTITRPSGRFQGYWWIEYGGQVDTIRDNEDVVMELRRLIYGFWDYIKNSGDFPDTANLVLEWVTPVPGKRESRRLEGDLILTQNDMERKTDFSDAIAVTGWPMDVHAPKGIYDDGPAAVWNYMPGMTNLPYRILYSKNVDNLFMAGRNVSVSHMALGTVRVMATCGAMAQAAGTAAAVAFKRGTSPRGVYEQHLDELRSALLAADQTILGLADESIRAGLAGATLEASSTRALALSSIDGTLPLDKRYCLAIPVEGGAFDSVDVYAVNGSSAALKLKVGAYEGSRPENYIPERKVAEAAVQVPGGFSGWLKVALDARGSVDGHSSASGKYAGGKAYLYFEPCAGLSLGYSRERLLGAVSFTVNPPNKESTSPLIGLNSLGRLRGKTFAFVGVQPGQTPYRVDNIADGYTRPYGLPRAWISGPLSEGPVKLRIGLPSARRVESIGLWFDTRLEEDNLDTVLGEMVKDYQICVRTADGKEQRIPVRENFRRFRSHLIGADGVTSIEVLIESTWGSPYATVFAVKLH